MLQVKEIMKRESSRDRISCSQTLSVIWLVLIVLVAPAALPAANLQQVLDHVMGGRAGAVVVMDAGPGRILAQYHPKVAAPELLW
jgi:hypothetical protein